MNPQYQYNMFYTTMPHPIFIMTDVNLLEMYKSALVSGSKVIMWEKGIINMELVIGIVDITPAPLSGEVK